MLTLSTMCPVQIIIICATIAESECYLIESQFCIVVHWATRMPVVEYVVAFSVWDKRILFYTCLSHKEEAYTWSLYERARRIGELKHDPVVIMMTTGY
jgi:hypothetical protein